RHFRDLPLGRCWSTDRTHRTRARDDERGLRSRRAAGAVSRRWCERLRDSLLSLRRLAAVRLLPGSAGRPAAVDPALREAAGTHRITPRPQVAGQILLDLFRAVLLRDRDGRGEYRCPPVDRIPPGERARIDPGRVARPTELAPHQQFRNRPATSP